MAKGTTVTEDKGTGIVKTATGWAIRAMKRLFGDFKTAGAARAAMKANAKAAGGKKAGVVAPKMNVLKGGGGGSAG